MATTSGLVRCKTCRFYTLREGWERGVCSNPRLGELGESEYLESGNYLAYPYNEGSIFEPGPNFGCINHEGVSCTD